MVQLMLEGFGGDARNTHHEVSQPQAIECYHVNSRVSEGMEDIGGMRPGKLILLLKHCFHALWCRFRYGADVLYYVPAPGKRSAVYRDWLVMLLCRPFFKKTVLHWHAVGLSSWLETAAKPFERWITKRLLSQVSLSIALTRFSTEDAVYFQSQRMEIVPNGIPDPCPEFETKLKAARLAQGRERREHLENRSADEARPVVYNALFLAHCTRDKGVFDALDGVAILNQRKRGIEVHLTVAGAFMNAEEEAEFRKRIARPDIAGAITYAGFVSGEQKARLLRESDCLCFPTYYSGESFGLVIVEAMAFGIPSVTTRWRGIPEILPDDYPGYVEPKSPEQVADALERMAIEEMTETLRGRYLRCFSVASYVAGLRDALLRLQ
jgi:glycosyltransferase involved in cell wall biosynthesis